ncbi:MAG TPA: hypothetical protein DD735_04415, partial [Clostridiales bacterium]|nr:hypothetical protein [Clostridiales bacterium]
MLEGGGIPASSVEKKKGKIKRTFVKLSKASRRQKIAPPSDHGRGLESSFFLGDANLIPSI